MPVPIRSYQSEDLLELMRIYRESVICIGPEYYTPDQVRAWSSFGNDKPAFEIWMEESDVYVATNTEGNALGFAGLEDSGRIASLYVAPGHMRQGIGSRLLNHLLDMARQQGYGRLSTDASEFSKPLFEAAGFIIRNIEETRFKGVLFHRYLMVRDHHLAG